MPATSSAQSAQGEEPGFALVVLPAVFGLLLLLAVGMLTRSALSIRQASIARANARPALMMAAGELQLEMGPETRISVKAAIHGTYAWWIEPEITRQRSASPPKSANSVRKHATATFPFRAMVCGLGVCVVFAK